MSSPEITYLENETVAKRMGVFAERVLSATQHGWPLERYMGGVAAQEADNIVRILVDAHLNPPYRKEGESAEDYDNRRDVATESVHGQLDIVEQKFMDIDLGDNPDPEIMRERIVRFGGQAAKAVRGEAYRNARLYLEMTGKLPPHPKINLENSGPFAVEVDMGVVNEILACERAKSIPLVERRN